MASAVLTVALSATAVPASATTPGWIDTTYGAGGAAVVPSAAFGVTAVDATGRAVVLGPTTSSGAGGRVARLAPNGQLDTLFGAKGTAFLNASIYYTRVALGPSGLIYVLGSYAPFGSPSGHFVVTRLTSAGAVDTSYGASGTATVAVPTGWPPFTSNSFIVRNDGDVVVNLVTGDTTKKGYLAALTPAGVLDTTFGPTISPGMFQLPDKEFIVRMAAAAAPTAPVFTASTPPTTATKGVAYRYTFAANGTPAPTFSVASGTLPAGATLSPTGVLSGTPTTVGDYTFAVKAANGVTPDAVTPSIAIHVNSAPVFTAASPPTTAKVGTAYSYTFAASGTPAPTFAVASGTLPTGLALAATTGVLSGTPTTGGAFSFTVKAANGVSPDAVTPSITIHVAAAPVFTAKSPPNANVGVAYSYTFAATGNPAPTFSVASGTLPTGLSLASNGVLSGVPKTAGAFTFAVKASNGVTPDAVTPNITMNIVATPAAPVFAAQSPPSTATVGRPYSYTFVANGYPAPTYTVFGTLPTGMTLAPSTGVLSGTPSEARTFYFRVRASNGVQPDAYTPLIVITVNSAAAAAAQPATAATQPAATQPAAAAAQPATAAAQPATAVAQPAAAAAQPAAAQPAAAAAAQPAAAGQAGATTTTTVAPDPNNTFVAVLANDTTASRTYVLQRYNIDGSLDTTFGTGGSSAAFPAAAKAIVPAEAPDGSYYVTGNDAQAVFLAHVLANGQFDSAFGTGGLLVGPVESCQPTGGLILFSGASIYVLAIDADTTCGASPAILLRFHGAAVDTTFGVAGEVRINSVAAIQVTGPNGGGLQPGGQVLIGLDGVAASATASAAVTRVIPAAAGPTVESYTQLVDDSHFAAATVAANPAGAYIATIGAVVDGNKVTHLYAEGANHHLFEFQQTGATWAAAADLTAATTGAPAVASPPKATFDGTNIDVFALGATGDLVMYRNNGASGAWTSTDINVAAGSTAPKVGVAVDPHVINGMLHVYAVTAGGDLVEIDNDNANGQAWNFYDLTTSAGGGVAVVGGPAALLLSSGTEPHVYTRAASNNDLVEFVADHANGHVWNAYDTTLSAPAAPPIGSNPVPTVINGTPHVYATSAASGAANGDLIEYVADHLNGSIWNAYDQSAGTGGAPKPAGNISVVLIDGTPYGIAIPIPEVWQTPASGELTVSVADHVAGRIWNTYDITSLSGGPRVTGDPTPIINGAGAVQVFGLGQASSTTAATTAPAALKANAGSTTPSKFLPAPPG